MRRFTTASLALTIAATGVLAGAAVVAAQDSSDLKIGLVTDVGTIDDKGFNESSWAGTLAGAESIGAPEPQFAISQTSADIAPNIQAFVDQEYDIIVTVGFASGGDTLEAAKASPDIRFVAVDQSFCLTEEGENDPTFTCAGDPAEFLPNVQGLNWREQQAAYLAGIVAADISETGHFGVIGGTATIPAVVNFVEGFNNGVLSVNPDAVVTVVYASGAADAAAFNDPAGGQALAQQLLAQDPEIDVIHAPAGKTGNGAIQAACDAGIWAVGFDLDQSQTLPEYAGCLVTSAEKKIANSVLGAIEKIAADEDQGGVLYLDISTNDVGISPFHDHADAVSDEAVAAIEAATAAMIDGSLVTCEAQEGSGFCVQTLP